MDRKNYKQSFELEEKVKLLDFLKNNYKIIVPLFTKLKQYIAFDSSGKQYIPFNKGEIELFNSIPVPENYKLKLPVEVFRGMNLSNDIVKKMKNEFKQNKKLIYNPKNKNYSSWTTNLTVARRYTKDGVDKKLILKSNITSKNKFVDIVLFQIIMFNLKQHMYNKMDNDEKISSIEMKIFHTGTGMVKYQEEEIIIFSKIIIDNIVK